MFKENGFDRIKAFNDFDDLETWVKGKGNSE
jgi:hypothetical protein